LEVFKDLIYQEYHDHDDNLETKVFTLFSQDNIVQVGDHQLPIITALPGWLNQLFLFCTKNKFPVLSWIFDYRNLMVFYPSLIKHLSKKIKKYLSDHDNT
jgi:hypothetical protein